MGEQHAAAYAAHPSCELVALCDFAPERLEAARAAAPELKLTPEAEEVLDDPDIDVVSITSYDSFHYEHVRRALERDKHVFVEKPLCLDQEHAAHLARLLRERPHLRLSSNLPLRMSPRFQLVKRWIDGGRFGRLYYLEGDYEYGRLWKITEGWRGDLDFYSVTLGGGVHLIDLLLWFAGERAVSVSARGNRVVTEGTKFKFDDLVVATGELESGALFKMAANFGCVHPHFHSVEVFGTDATFLNGLESGTLWTKGEDGELASEPVTAAYPGAGKGDLIQSFVESILGRGEAIVTAEEVFHAMAVCFAIEKAAATGETVDVPDL